MAKRKSVQTIKYSQDEKLEICRIVDMGITHSLHQEAVVSLLLEKIPKMTRNSAKAAMAWRKRALAYGTDRIVKEEDTNRGVYILRLESAYALAMERGDTKTALAAAKDLAGVFGVIATAPPQKHPKLIGSNNNVLLVGGPTGDLSELSDTQLAISLGRKIISPAQAQKLCDDSRGNYAEEVE